MNSSTPIPSIFDINSLTALKSRAKDNDPQAIKATAKQFEALFLQMVLKSMHDATPHQGMFDSDQTRFYESLLDSQMAQVMANKGGTGLSALIERQLTRKDAVVGTEAATPALPLQPAAVPLPLDKPGFLPLNNPAEVKSYPLSPGAMPLQRNLGAGSERSTSETLPSAATVQSAASSAASAPAVAVGSPSATAADFVARLRPHAAAAEQATGIPAHFMIAQAALETGWGRSEPRHADGTPSYNLFGIKAGRGWKGETVETSTVEYANGQPQRQVAQFRSYHSYTEAFQDYANLLANSPRYSSALGSQSGAEFAQALQDAGYATDPQYAAKLQRIMGSAALKA